MLVQQILFSHTTPKGSIHHGLFPNNEYPEVFWLHHSFVQYGSSTSFERRSHAHTFYCSSLGNFSMNDLIIDLLFLYYARLFCKKLHASCNFCLIVCSICYRSSNITTPAFLNMNTCLFDVLESPLYSKHAPVSLNIEGSASFFRTLLLCLTEVVNKHFDRFLTWGVRSKYRWDFNAVTACAVRMSPSILLN